MAVQVRIPTPLQMITHHQGVVTATGSNIREVLLDLERQYPGIRDRLYDDKGTLRRFINIYLNDEDIRFLNGEETAVKDGDEVSVIPAIAGGSEPRLNAQR
ncbi:MAG: MoaD/ThiS family protein [Candidatus Tectomicrobia bacterium]|uniref:MoaD/ThiS family protein n=1 Tax=Tectimicrobiota bacterium TaxID=2528274 RepID=A0A932CND4_UNCTE|nr:MoaD/ThiS family protein [Candidatus Tectomicrobia bacterium]